MNQLFKKYASLLIPFLFLIIYFTSSYYHNLFEEWDGVIQYFQGNSIFQGHGYSNWGAHYWPPMYSLLTGLFSKFTTGFMAAKLVSVLSSVLTLVVIYFFSLELFGNKKIALFIQFLIAINPYFYISSIQAENHMLDTFFFVTAVFYLIKVIKRPEVKKNILLLGGFSALAALSRYTSYALVPLIFIVFVFINNRKYLIVNSLLFSGIFILLNLPWYYYNFLINGSPLENWQYLNIGSYIYPGGIDKWQWLGQNQFNNVSDIFNRFPSEYIQNFFRNLMDGCIYVIKAIKIILLISLILIGIHWKKITAERLKYYLLNPIFIMIMIGFFVFLVLVSQAFVFMEVFLSWNIIFSIIVLWLVAGIIEYPKIKNQFYLIMLGLIVLNIGYTGIHIHAYLNEKDDSGQLVDNEEITSVLKGQNNIHESYIMAIHPARAYYAQSHYMLLPGYFEGTVDQVINYGGLSEKVKSTQPKYPMIDNFRIHADYLIFEKCSAKILPQYEFLFNEKDAQIPKNFKMIYKSPNSVVYRIEKL